MWPRDTDVKHRGDARCEEFGVEDCGKLPGFNFYRTKFDWMAGIAVFNPKAAARLMAIKNA